MSVTVNDRAPKWRCFLTLEPASKGRGGGVGSNGRGGSGGKRISVTGGKGGRGGGVAGTESFCREMRWDSDRSAFIHDRVSIDDLPQVLLQPSTECIARCTIVKAMVGVGSKASSARSSSSRSSSSSKRKGRRRSLGRSGTDIGEPVVETSTPFTVTAGPPVALHFKGRAVLEDTLRLHDGVLTDSCHLFPPGGKLVITDARGNAYHGSATLTVSLEEVGSTDVRRQTSARALFRRKENMAGSASETDTFRADQDASSDAFVALPSYVFEDGAKESFTGKYRVVVAVTDGSDTEDGDIELSSNPFIYYSAKERRQQSKEQATRVTAANRRKRDIVNELEEKMSEQCEAQIDLRDNLQPEVSMHKERRNNELNVHL